jgi:hypothetical protein
MVNKIKAGFNYFFKLATSTYNERANFYSDSGYNEMHKLLISDFELGSNAKMGWIGLWGHDKYDIKNLFGFELRFLNGSNLTTGLIDFLNHLHYNVENHLFGIEESKIKNWVNYIGSKHSLNFYLNLMLETKLPEKSIASPETYAFISPHRDYADLLTNLPYGMKKILVGLDETKTTQAFTEHGRLRYLIHDWRRDPLLFDNLEALIKIENAQLRALRQWANGVNERIVLQNFLLESDLYLLFAESIDLKI